MDKLRKKLQKLDGGGGMELVAVDAPFDHPDDKQMRQWWHHREGNDYVGFEETVRKLQSSWGQEGCCVGMMGFSQGARVAHLAAMCHHRDPSTYFPGLQFVILVAGYDAPLPNKNFFESIGNCGGDLAASLSSNDNRNGKLSTKSLHVWGENDKLIAPDQSEAVTHHYVDPQSATHDGGHHVPMRAASVRAMTEFIEGAVLASSCQQIGSRVNNNSAVVSLVPDEECSQAQIEEVEALNAIFPDEFRLLSNGLIDEQQYEHPIKYQLDLPSNADEGVWPPHPIAIQCEYPHNYPLAAAPKLRLIHDNNVMEFSTRQSEACVKAMEEAAAAEEGMPCVLSAINAARDFFESGAMATTAEEISKSPPGGDVDLSSVDAGVGDTDELSESASDKGGTPEAAHGVCTPLIKKSTPERIRECNLQGLNIAENILKRASSSAGADAGTHSPATGKGGSWTYTIGLVGKPSAGKSTFFNAATAFARQRDDSSNSLGGATMAPHPFTTIDPNTGFCLVPAPTGSCPEEGYEGELKFQFGSTHGRDAVGRRLLPVLLKDVAGLVPGAYQGRGRGNKFLNDLCDADVLIHVLDGSGLADSEGNALVDETTQEGDDNEHTVVSSQPLDDVAWIHSELVEWVYSNLMSKWEVIRRRGRSKVTGMFSGYGQSQAVTQGVLNAVEKYLEQMEGRDHALDHLDEWDEGDVHRLVSAFLGVRFPMALAINKSDIPSSKQNIEKIQAALPIHGAHVGIPLSARREMQFVRRNIQAALGLSSQVKKGSEGMHDEAKPIGVWQCLQSSLALREPILVFPVSDFNSLSPLPGLLKHATEDPSLPNKGSVACLQQAGGSAPTLWEPGQSNYAPPSGKRNSSTCLRDVLVMKPGSTVEDVYLTLKRLGALSGEFVRAEGCGELGSQAKPIPKYQIITRANRIIKIMSNKRTAWQSK